MTLKVKLHGPVSNDFALDLAFGVSAQGITALLGPSGSGKTSVLRAIAGLDRIPGAISFEGHIWQDAQIFIPPHKRRLGYVFQGAGLLPHLTVSQNLEYAARRAHAGPFDRENIIARLGIAELLDRSPVRLSGGESQRANIARALISQPRLLLMDEPLSALDVDARSDLLGSLHGLLGDAALPTLYVTHDIGEAQQIADQVIWLDNGRLALSSQGG